MLVPKATNRSKQSSHEAPNHPSLYVPMVVLPAMAVVAPQSNRHEVNPALALKLLRDIERSVLQWQVELRRVVSEIEALHAEGPMVDGWLASSIEPTPSVAQTGQCVETTLLRHGDADALMQYVEALESKELGHQPAAGVGLDKSDRPSTGTQYQLCWLNDEGKVCSQACPPEQMAVVSTAIARYQKCKQFLAQQRVLESRLQSTVDELTVVRNTSQQRH